MLQFWKRSGQREKAGSPINDTTQTCTIVNGNEKVTSCSAYSILAAFDQENLSGLTSTRPTFSRLSESLQEVLNDKNALGYFVQYLSVNGGFAYARCWLDMENFRTVITNTNLNEQSEENDARSRLDHDNLSMSTDCDSSSLNDNSSEYRYDNLKPTPIEEALRIFKKYIAPEAPHPITCPEPLRNEFIESICNDTGIVDAFCFDQIKKHVTAILEQKYFDSYTRSHYNCKYQIDVLTSGHVTLSDILYSETILFYFMEFLEQENASNLLEFWLAVINFERGHSDSDLNAAQNDAVVLYDKYFSLQAICPLGFSDRIRCLVEENICNESGANSECFRQPIQIIEHVLEQNYFKPFLSSQLYFKYLSELINTIQTNGCVQTTLEERERERERKSTHSDCSSEIFLDESTLNVRKKGTKSESVLSIDSVQLYDPDALWKRRGRARALSFGRVTDLGRFETGVEPEEPSRDAVSRLRRVLKRVVNLEESKTKEEMAWQVAEMIVKDVTSVTLAEGQS